MAELAARADVSERTLIRLEKGDPGVGIGNLASVLAALGNPAALAEIMSPENDTLGLSLAFQSVPKRGRSFKPGQPRLSTGEASERQVARTPSKQRKGIAF
jgi:transcriptional regulator with XRE-family HTH domain